ncbi:MAG: hypothetical protein F6K55_20145 [Moorea sp. SIO4A3]|nr:hypothetical protein [Moorena sp. SIO4A3]
MRRWGGWGDGEMGRVGSVGRWGDGEGGEMGRCRDGDQLACSPLIKGG